MPNGQDIHPIRPNIIRQKLVQLGRDVAWLADLLRLRLETVEGWFEDKVPPEGLTIKLKLEGDDAEDSASVSAEYSLDEYLDLQIQAADLGLTLPEMLEQAVRTYREEYESRRQLPSYTREGNIIRVDFGRR